MVQRADRRQVVFYEPPLTPEFGVPETIGETESLPFGNLGISFHVYGTSTLATSKFA